MTKRESPTQQIFPSQYRPEGDVYDRDIVKAELHKAQVVCDTVKSLFSQLARDRVCQPPHSAFVHLTGFGQPEIGMTMSLCEVKGIQWHQVYLASKIPSNVGVVHQCESICSELRAAKQSEEALRIYLETDGSLKCAAPPAAVRIVSCYQYPRRTLEKLLNARQHHSGRKLLKKDKLNIAVAIAQSSLHLSGSPLMQSRWNAENIYITHTADKVFHSWLHTKLYIARQLSHEFPNEEPDDLSNGTRVVLDLGLLLWQLLFGRKVTIQPEDREDEDDDDPNLTLFNALNREYDDCLESFVEKPCLDIIENCLNLYSSYQLDQQTFQEKIYWNIVTPLQNYLEFSYQFKKPPQDLKRVRTAPFPICAASVKSATKPSKGLYEKNRHKGSLGKGFVVKDECDITAGQRKTASQRPTFAGSNLLAFSGDVR
jgi:hypothetical protein